MSTCNEENRLSDLGLFLATMPSLVSLKKTWWLSIPRARLDFYDTNLGPKTSRTTLDTKPLANGDESIFTLPKTNIAPKNAGFQ